MTAATSKTETPEESINTEESKPTEEAEPDIEARVTEAQSIVKTNVIWAMGVGVVPLPVIDLVGISAVQIKMLKQLSDHYEIPFAEHKVKNVIGALVAGLGSVGIGGAVAFSVFKLVPFMGHLAGTLAIPVAAGALTFAVGAVFIQHFESGGTFLDFDPVAVREHFREEFEKAKTLVQEMHLDQKKKVEKGDKTKK